MASTQVVLFAIRAAMRLGDATRRVYVDATRERSIALPLPSVNFRPNAQSASTFFGGRGSKYVKPGSRLADLCARWRQARLSAEEIEEFKSTFKEMRLLDDATASGKPVVMDGVPIDASEFAALLEVRQWATDDSDRPKALQRLIGVVIDLSVEYLATVPGGMRKGSKNERVVAGLVEALDRIDFEELAVDDDIARRLVGRLLVAALETIGAQPEIVSSDPNVRKLVTLATEGLARDVGPKLGELSDDHVQRDRLEDWAELVMRSLLSTAGREVVAHPALYLGTDSAGESALIRNVGRSLLDVAVTDDGLELERVFGREGLETVARASLKTLAEHPELVTDDSKALSAVLSGVAGTLAGEDTPLLSADIAPEVVRLVLLHTGRNLPLVWPDAETKPGKQALLIATQEVLAALGADPGDAPWKVRFGSEDVLFVLDATLDALASNPAWVAAVLHDADANVGAAVHAAVEVIRANADARLGPRAAAEIVVAALSAIAVRSEFLHAVPGGEPFVAKAVETVLAALFADGVEEAVQWQLLRDDAVAFLVEAALGALAEQAADRFDAAPLATLETFLADRLAELATGAALNFEVLEYELGVALSDAAAGGGQQ